MRPQGHAKPMQAASLSILLIVCFWFVVPTRVDAQESTATVNGSIFDPSGAVVPESEVFLTNTQTSVVQHTVTDNVGFYAFLNIIPGQYTMRASKPGFKTVDQSAFSLAVNQTATVNFTLPVGATGQAVTVSARATH